MKCLKMCVLVIWIMLGIVHVSSGNIASIGNCDIAAHELLHEFGRCASETYKATDIIGIIEEYKNQLINSTVFSQSIIDYCVTLKNASTCSLRKVTNIPPRCRHTPLMERCVNLMRVVDRVGADFCSEQILYNVANDSGFTCLRNKNLDNCRHLPPALADSAFSLDDNNICATMKQYQACGADVLEECQIDGEIKQYVKQVWNSLNDEFSCGV